MGILASIHWPMEGKQSHGAQAGRNSISRAIQKICMLESTVFPWILDVWFVATHKKLLLNYRILAEPTHWHNALSVDDRSR